MKVKELMEILKDLDQEREINFAIPKGDGYVAMYDIASKAWESPDGLRIQLGQNNETAKQ